MGRFETEVLATEENLAALPDLSGQWIDSVHDRRPPTRIILDMDSSVSPTHGEQEGSAYNGHFGCTCYHPLFLFNQFGDLERCSLRPGNVHSADDWEGVLKPVVVRYKNREVRLYFRGDAAFASPEMYEYLEAEGFLYAIRLPANRVLQESIAHLLTRPVGRPPNHVRRYYASFSYQAGSWDRKRRVVAKVEWHPGELYPRVGFIVTNLSRPAERVVAFYNKRGTAEQWIKEGKNAIKWTRLSCRKFRNNAVRLQLHALAYNLANFMRTLALPKEVEHWSLTTLREKLVKIGAKVVSHGRYVTFQLAEVAVPRDLFRKILRLMAFRPQETENIRSSDACGEHSVPSTRLRGYDFHKPGGCLGNIGVDVPEGVVCGPLASGSRRPQRSSYRANSLLSGYHAGAARRGFPRRPWMMRSTPTLLVISLAILIAGCITTRGRIMQSWVGKTSNELLTSWGAPDSTAPLDDGGRVLTWVGVEGDSSGVRTCRRSFTVDRQGVVSGSSYSGCSILIIRVPWPG